MSLSHRSAIKYSVMTLALLPGLALAHEGHVSISGFGAGFAHPLGGFDHVLAMLAVGFWSAHQGGHARWQLPLVFVIALLLGGAMGIAGMTVPLLTLATEPMILTSSVVVGLMLALNGTLRTATAAILCAGFALFHGLAHGAEIPAGSSALAYGTGFALATAVLHGIGLLSGLAVGVWPGMHRWAGGLIACFGLLLAIS